jgi:hypothetical protein
MKEIIDITAQIGPWVSQVPTSTLRVAYSWKNVIIEPHD